MTTEIVKITCSKCDTLLSEFEGTFNVYGDYTAYCKKCTKCTQEDT